MADLREARRVLVVADRPAAITIGHWCRTISALGDGGLEWVVITWDRLEKVADHTWDVIIADEAHALRRTTTKRWKLWARVSGHGKPHDAAPFVIATTATPGHTPLELPYLAPAYAQVLGEPMRQWASATKAGEIFADALERHGVGVEHGRYGATWTSDPARRAADLTLVRGWLDDERPPAMLHRAAPWGPVPISGMPVALTPAERTAYEAEWGEFCREMDIARRGRNVAKGRAALLRFRQKAGLMRVDSTVAWIAQQVETERQVACSVEFVATAADPIADRLRDSGIEVATIYGRDRFDPEAERLRFQTGEAKVCVFTTVASISLHAGETLADGRQASTEPRVGVFHQARFSGIAGRQVTGRTHRDHQVSPWHIAYAEGTVEEQVGKVMVERIAAASDTVGSDTTGWPTSPASSAPTGCRPRRSPRTAADGTPTGCKTARAHSARGADAHSPDARRRIPGRLSDRAGTGAPTGLVPPAAETERLARTREEEHEEHQHVHDVLVHERVVGRREDGAPHHHQEQCAGIRRDAHGDAEHQGDADACEAEHEQPVSPSRTGDGVVGALEGSSRAEAEEPEGGAAAVDPGVLRLRCVAESEHLVEERPQEDPAERDPGEAAEEVGGSRPAGGGRGRRRLTRRTGGSRVVGRGEGLRCQRS